MPIFVHAKQYRAKVKRNPISGTVVLKNNKPVYQKTFHEAAQGGVIEIPPDGFAVRDADRQDSAMTRIDFGRDFVRAKAVPGSGDPMGDPSKWHKYKRV